MVLKSWEEKFHRGSFSLFFFFFSPSSKSKSSVQQSDLHQHGSETLKDLIFGIVNNPAERTFYKVPRWRFDSCQLLRLLTLILPFLKKKKKKKKSSPAQTLTTETEETSGWYRFDYSLWSSDFAHTLRQLVSLFFFFFFCSFLINVTPWPSVRGQQQQQHLVGSGSQTWDGGPGHTHLTALPLSCHNNMKAISQPRFVSAVPNLKRPHWELRKRERERKNTICLNSVFS